MKSTDELHLVDHLAWSQRARWHLESDIAPFIVWNNGRKIRIAPEAHLQHDVLVLGNDWLPILADGSFTVERMVHSADLYPNKIRNLERCGENAWRPKYGRSRTLVEPSVLIGGSRNYFHWMIDYLPRLLWLERRGLLEGRRILINDEMTAFQRDSLAALGIDSTRLYELADTEAVYCKDLLVPDFFAANTVTHPAAVAMLREAYLSQDGKRIGPAERINLSRRDAANRRLHNEDRALALSSAAGFRTVTTVGMPFQEQVGLFAGAEALLGVHGAGLTNMLFCPPGSHVIEIALQSHRVSSMRMLSLVCGHVHAFVDASTGPLADGINPLLVDWSVDEADLARRLGTLPTRNQDPRVG